MKKYYYMKDVMERFDITRDTVKYYEKKGLIASVRDKNGYRQYDQITVKKLERIQMLRSMGFSLDAIKLSLSDGKMTENGNLAFDDRIREIEKQQSYLATVKNLLKRSKERALSHSDYYWNCHRYDCFAVCMGSAGRGNCLQDPAWKCEMGIFRVKEDGSIEQDDYLDGVIAEEMILSNGQCINCSHQRMICQPAVRGVIKLSESSRVPELIGKMYLFGENHGYVLERKVYCTYNYYCEPEEEGIALDLYIPIINVEKDENREDVL